jgi:hypothetical protein
MRAQSQPSAFIKRLEKELALNIATCDRLAVLNALQSTEWSIQWKEVICRSSIRTSASLERDSATVLVHDRTARTSSTSGGVGLVVACVEIAVPLAIFRGISIQATDDT